MLPCLSPLIILSIKSFLYASLIFIKFFDSILKSDNGG